MTRLIADVGLGLRLLRSQPGFTAVAVLTLALGIGANTAVYSVVNAVLLRPLPYADPEGLLRVSERRPAMPGLGPVTILTNETYHAWTAGTQTLEAIAAYSDGAFTVTGDVEPRRVRGARISASLLPMLQVSPAIGRRFTSDDEREGADAVAIISDSLWRSTFGADAAAVGRLVTIDERPHTIVGVMPSSFAFPEPDAEIWVPFVVPPASTNPSERRIFAFSALARLRPGVTVTQAQAEGTSVLTTLLADRRAPSVPGDAPTMSLRSLQEDLVAEVRPALLVLSGTVVLVLLIAIANLANLQLARSASRQREMAIRAAIGASRWRLLQQMLIESVLLALVGGAAGLLLAWALVRLVPALAPADIPRVADVALDAGALLFTLGVASAAGILIGLAPGLQGMRAQPARALAEGGTRATGGFRFTRGDRTRLLLLVTEVALALVLLIGAGLLITSFARLVDVDPGYDASNVITAAVNLPTARYPPAAANAFMDQVLERLASPRVEAAAFAGSLPLTPGEMVVAFRREDQRDAADPRPSTASVRVITDDYPRALGIPIVEGRGLLPSDTVERQLVALVNQAFVRAYFPGESIVGRTLPVFAGGTEIVGVVGDVRHGGLDADPRPEVYVSPRQSRQFRTPGLYLVIRAAGDPLALVPELRAIVQSIDPALPLSSIMTMEARVSASVAHPRFYAVVVGLFGGLAALLAGVGVYGVVSYGVAQRTREIGVRMALGADRREILGLVVWQGGRMVGVGLALGAAGAAAASRGLTGLLFGVTAGDPAVYAGVTTILGLVALLACYLPARRATNVQPSEALRCE